MQGLEKLYAIKGEIVTKIEILQQQLQQTNAEILKIGQKNQLEQIQKEQEKEDK